MKKILYAILILSGVISINGAKRCNGLEKLCDRPYNQVSYPGVHNLARQNAYNFIDIKNQSVKAETMLRAGIRFFKLPIHKHNGKAFICHGVSNRTANGIIQACKKHFNKLPKQLSWLSAIPMNVCNHIANNMKSKPCILDDSSLQLSSFIKILKTFLNTHPNEIVTLLLEDYTKDYGSIDKAFAPLHTQMHTQDVNSSWPTLGQMIDTNQRLVVFVDRNWKGPGSKFLNQGDFIFESDWDTKSVDKLKNSISIIKRGHSNFDQRNTKPKNKLWLMWNMVTPQTGGSLTAAKQVNRIQLLINRWKKFHSKFETGIPNFVAVDFFEVPLQQVKNQFKSQRPGVIQFTRYVNNSVKRKSITQPTSTTTQPSSSGDHIPGGSTKQPNAPGEIHGGPGTPGKHGTMPSGGEHPSDIPH